MKKKLFTSLGLMSGTSMDGIDLSIIKSDGFDEYTTIIDQYFKYNNGIYENLITLRDRICNLADLTKYKSDLDELERKISIFNAETVNNVLSKNNLNVDLIGFHGQTIYHNAKEKVSIQLGDGNLLSQLTKKKVVFNFRKNDLANGGQGAPLTPIFHQLLEKKFNLGQVIFINIGGIINSTTISNNQIISASDHGPGMCLIDEWIRKKMNKRFDTDGNIAKTGRINKIILDQALDNFFNNENYYNQSKNKNKSFDTKDFNFSFIRGLSLEDGAATLTEFSAQIIKDIIDSKLNSYDKAKVYLCGGGRKNKFLIDSVREKNQNIKQIDELGIDGDYVESQAFAYIAIRSFLELEITFPETTGCKIPCSGGVLTNNY